MCGRLITFSEEGNISLFFQTVFQNSAKKSQRVCLASFTEMKWKVILCNCFHYLLSELCYFSVVEVA
jgi:hypothetical protein